MATLEKPDSSDKEAVIKYADGLYSNGKLEELMTYLQEVLGSGNDPDIVWRILRCGFRLGQQTLNEGNSREAEHIAETALEIGRRSLKEHDGNFGLHKVSFTLDIWFCEVLASMRVLCIAHSGLG